MAIKIDDLVNIRPITLTFNNKEISITPDDEYKHRLLGFFNGDKDEISLNGHRITSFNNRVYFNSIPTSQTLSDFIPGIEIQNISLPLATLSKFHYS